MDELTNVERQAGAASAVERSVGGPSYNGVNMSLMLERLRQTYGYVSMSSGGDAHGRWAVRAWSGAIDPVVAVDVTGCTPFHALMTAYRTIHKNYADQDAHLREQLSDWMAANASLTVGREAD